jgi:hypothetical protein
MLARRLTRRGIALSGGTLAAMLTHNAVPASMPPSPVCSAIQAATALAAGLAAASGLVSVKVAALTQGVLNSMLLTKLKTAVAVLVVVLVLGAGLGRAGRLYVARAAHVPPDGSEEKDARKSGGEPPADDKKGDFALTGTWGRKHGALKIEFADKGVMKIAPHGDMTAITITCDYTFEKGRVVKAKVTGAEGTGQQKKHIEMLLPAGTKFSFKWTVKSGRRQARRPDGRQGRGAATPSGRGFRAEKRAQERWPRRE